MALGHNERTALQALEEGPKRISQLSMREINKMDALMKHGYVLAKKDWHITYHITYLGQMELKRSIRLAQERLE